jgi:hypothetical protein
VVIGVRLGKEERLHLLVPGSVRLVVDGPAALVLDDVALVVQLLLGHRREEARQPIRLEP